MGELSKVIVGKEDTLETVLLAILAGGHVLIEDYPGLAKTLIAKSFAAALGMDFRRIQFTPDLLPADITGTYLFNRTTSKFELRNGPIFTNILLADEINRAPPRTQSALLEAMQEKQVTIEGDTLKLEEPFIVIATENPIEYEGTYPLPEAQVDRLMVKLGVGFPTADEEVQILELREQRMTYEALLDRVCSRQEVLVMQREAEEVHLDRNVMQYIVEIVDRTRTHAKVEIGASPRGSLAIAKLSKISAYVNGRGFVIPDDVKRVAAPALIHRLILKPEGWLRGETTKPIIEEIMREVPVPKVA